jgi:hydroxymethylglutaryl-CoA lyase
LNDGFPRRVTLVEVGPRDGLQNIDTPIEVELKVRFVEALARAGLPVVEVGSFVNPKVIPQMADTQRVYAQIQRQAGTRYPALVPNERGLDAALGSGVEEIAVFTATSETFNHHNIRATIAESLERFRPVVRRARDANLRVRGYVSCCFGCPFEGDVPAQRVVDVTQELLALGVQEVSLGDTIGVAVPTQVDRVLEVVLKSVPVDVVALHFHDTRGTAVANVLQALRWGVHIFDASAGGLGGCPYAPGATGNVATEDLVYLLRGMGIETGVDLVRLLDASMLMERRLGAPLPSRALRALLAERTRESAAAD